MVANPRNHTRRGERVNEDAIKEEVKERLTLKQKGEKEWDFLFEKPTPELFWRDLPMGGYLVLLHNFVKGRKSAAANVKGVNWNYDYFKWKTTLIKGFDKLNLEKKYQHWMHFPKKTFRIAWRTGPNRVQLEEEQELDLLLCFEKAKGSRVVIRAREYIWKH